MSEEFRKTPPEPLAPIPFNIPHAFETSLANGLRVVIFENKRLPIVNFRLVLPSGEINAPYRGISSAMTTLLTQGTERFSSRELAEEVDKYGASLNASCSSDNTTISASSLKLYETEILELMAEIVLRPTFPEKELNLIKENTIKGLQFQRSQPDFLADEQMSRIIYGEHPYAQTSPSVVDIEKLSREILVDYRRETLIPNNAIFIAVGDIEREALLRQLNEKFGHWQAGTVVKMEFATLPKREGRTLTIVDRIGSAQSTIVLSNLGIERTNPDYFSVLVMNQILGAGASSRLFMNLREEKGYTYGAYSSFDMRRLAGTFEATTEVRTPVTGVTIKEFFFELERIRAERVADSELQDAKNFLTGVFPLRAETQEGLTNLIVTQKLCDLPDDYLQTYRGKINAVTCEDIQNAAQKYIQPDKIALVIVGDAGEILSQASGYSDKIEVFDEQGKLLNLENYQQKANDEPADFNGKWDISVEIQGQSLPVTFEIAQSDSTFTGKFQSMFGGGDIAEGKISGNKATGNVAINFQGQNVDLMLNGLLDENHIFKGILAPNLDGMPDIKFSGTKKA